MVYNVELSAEVDRELGKLDAKQAKRILKFLHDRVARLDHRGANPLVPGSPDIDVQLAMSASCQANTGCVAGALGYVPYRGWACGARASSHWTGAVHRR